METDTEIKRGPGRPPTPKTASVVYTPLDPGDPHTTTAHGFNFKANVPQDIALDHFVKVENTQDRNNVVEILRGNPWFTVDGKRQPRRKPTADPVPPAGQDIDPVALDDRKMIEGD